MNSLHYGKKRYRYVDFLLLEVENIELLRIAGENEYGLLCNSDGVPVIPGTSIAGAVQDYLEEKKDSYYQTFWGNKNFDNKVYFFDSTMQMQHDGIMNLIEERTGHKHDAKFGGAENRKLYTERFLKKGGRFQIVVKVFTMQDEQVKVMDFFEHMLNGMESGEILFGSRKNNGCGQFHIHNAYHANFDFTNKLDLISYYRFEIYNKNEKKYNFLPNWKRESLAEEKIRFTLHGHIKDALLIQAEVSKEEEYQAIQSMKSGEDYIIPATTVKGILRGYCEKICNTCDWAFGEDLIETMFGTSSERMNSSGKMNRGMIRVRDVVIKEPKNMEYTRIKIDPFTGGTVNGAKMTSNPVIEGELDFQIELDANWTKYSAEENEAQEDRTTQLELNRAVTLLYFCLRDIGQEKVPIGSFASVGFGRISGDKIKLFVPKKYYSKAVQRKEQENLEGEIVLGTELDYSNGVREYLTSCLNALTGEELKSE